MERFIMKKLLKNSTCQRVLVSLLALIMVVGVVSTSLFAITTNALEGTGSQGTATVLGGSWDLVSTNCGKEHVHTADCYSDHKICDHDADGHSPVCYVETTAYSLCTGGGHEHTGVVD